MFSESKELCEIKEEMNEEINLLQRFELFAKRIQQLQDELKEYHANGVPLMG